MSTAVYPDIFRNVLPGSLAEEEVLDTLKRWLPVYLREIELQHDIPRDSLPIPQSYSGSDSDLDNENGMLPAIVAICPGLGNTKPYQHGDGRIDAHFTVAVGVIVSANNMPNTRKLVRLYTAACRTILLQRQSLNGRGGGVIWMDESYDDEFEFSDTQTISAGSVLVEVQINYIMNRYGGPAIAAAPDPDTQPGSEWPIVLEVDVSAEPMP